MSFSRLSTLKLKLGAFAFRDLSSLYFFLPTLFFLLSSLPSRTEKEKLMLV